MLLLSCPKSCIAYVLDCLSVACSGLLIILPQKKAFRPVDAAGPIFLHSLGLCHLHKLTLTR